MAGLAEELGALLLVALVADFRLAFQSQHRVAGRMQVVAIDAGVAFYIVHAARPMKAGTTLMATEADLVLGLDIGTLREGDGR